MLGSGRVNLSSIRAGKKNTKCPPFPSCQTSQHPGGWTGWIWTSQLIPRNQHQLSIGISPNMSGVALMTHQTFEKFSGFSLGFFRGTGGPPAMTWDICAKRISLIHRMFRGFHSSGSEMVHHITQPKKSHEAWCFIQTSQGKIHRFLSFYIFIPSINLLKSHKSPHFIPQFPHHFLWKKSGAKHKSPPWWSHLKKKVYRLPVHFIPILTWFQEDIPCFQQYHKKQQASLRFLRQIHHPGFHSFQHFWPIYHHPSNRFLHFSSLKSGCDRDSNSGCFFFGIVALHLCSEPSELNKKMCGAFQALGDGEKKITHWNSGDGDVVKGYQIKCDVQGSDCETQTHHVMWSGCLKSRLFLKRTEFSPKGNPIMAKVEEYGVRSFRKPSFVSGRHIDIDIFFGV